MPHIQGYKIIPLNELMAQLDKERVTAILSSFSSPMNRDVELFLKQKAVTFDTQSISRTHLVFTSYKEQTVLAGYFTLAYKDFTIPAKNVGRSLRDRIKKFGSYDFETKAYKISAPLIAQLSKNFTDGYNKLISGDELLTMACNIVDTSACRRKNRLRRVRGQTKACRVLSAQRLRRIQRTSARCKIKREYGCKLSGTDAAIFVEFKRKAPARGLSC